MNRIPNEDWQVVALEVGQSLEDALKRIAELEAQVKSWREAHERAAVIAAEELNRQKAEYEARLAEAEIQRNYELSWKEANAAQAQKLTETVEQLSARLAEAEAIQAMIREERDDNYKRAEALRAALEKVEWEETGNSGDKYYCPWWR